MKTTIITVIILVFSSPCFAQTQQKDTNKTKKDPIKTDTTKIKKDNFLDLGAGTLTQIFGENMDGKTNGKKLSFLEFLKKIDMPEAQKAEYKNWYFLQAKDLTEKQKDSLGLAIQKKILEVKKAN